MQQGRVAGEEKGVVRAGLEEQFVTCGGEVVDPVVDGFYFLELRDSFGFILLMMFLEANLQFPG